MAQNFNYYQAPQQGYDFAPIERGAETAASLRASAMQQAAANILSGVNTGRELRARQDEAAKSRAYDQQKSAQDRLATASLQALANDNASRREVARQAFELNQDEARNQTTLERERIQEAGWMDRTKAQIGLQEQARIAQEQRARAEAERMAGLKAKATKGIYHALAEPDGPYNPISEVTIDPFVATGMTEDDMREAFMQRGIPEADAKARAKELSRPRKVKVLDPTKLQALKTRLANEIDPIAGPQALDESVLMRPDGKGYIAPTLDEAFQKESDNFDKQFGRVPSRFPQDRAPAPEHVGNAGRQPRPISQASPEDLQALSLKLDAEMAKDPSIKAIKGEPPTQVVGESADAFQKRMMLRQITVARAHNLALRRLAASNNWIMDTTQFDAQVPVPKNETEDQWYERVMMMEQQPEPATIGPTDEEGG